MGKFRDRSSGNIAPPIMVSLFYPGRNCLFNSLPHIRTIDLDFVKQSTPPKAMCESFNILDPVTSLQVLSRVANFVMTRIPECVDVEVEDPAQLEDADPPEANVKAPEI